MKKDTLKYNIVEYIPAGCENAVSRKTLCIITGMSDREVRAMIERARRETIIISNTDGSGYWLYPDNPTEHEKEMLQRYVKQQESRAKSIFYALYPARKAIKEGGANGR